jgi:hypothetical protein
VKKDCEKLIAEKKDGITTNTSTSSTPGHLRNVKEDLFEDAVSEDVADPMPDTSSNDTNEDDLYYFARVTNHYLRLVKASPSVLVHPRHQMQFPIIADSGANFHMFKEREFFEN